MSLLDNLLGGCRTLAPDRPAAHAHLDTAGRVILAMLISLCLGLAAPAKAAVEPAPRAGLEGTSPAGAAPAATSESIGGQLLDDLAPGLFQETNPPADSSRPANGGEPAVPREKPLDGPLDPSLWFPDPLPLDRIGEDVGPASPAAPLPLIRARDGMQQARALIARHEALAEAGPIAEARQVQQQVVAQLDELIAELSKQCQGGDCQPSDQPPPASQRSGTRPGHAGARPGQGRAALQDSTARLDQDSAQPVEMADIEEIVKQLWGHLPERSREQMLQSFSEEFLPKYELEIEQYYRRLSEDRQR